MNIHSTGSAALCSRSYLLLPRRASRALIRPQVVLCIRQHELLRRHGCRAGRSLRARTSRLLPCLRPVGNGAFIVSTSRAPQRPGQRVNINNAVPSTRYNVRLDQHVTPLSFKTFLNIRSLLNKLDDILELRRDRLFDVLCLVETWHYSDSVCVQRLRAEGFRVIDRARQRLDSGCSTAPNYSGIILFSTSRVRMSLIDVACASTFDVVSIRLTSGSYHCVLVVIYRPGSVAVTVKFFTELAGVLDRVAVLSEPVFVAGDVNIRLDRPNESSTRQLVALFASRGLLISATESTHDGGGTIDVVASSSAAGADPVSVIDAGLSDHRLLFWSVDTDAPRCLSPAPRMCRSWRRLAFDDFLRALQSSRLCQPNVWVDISVDDLASLYDGELIAFADQLVPSHAVVRRKRPSDQWFDRDCRVTKSELRRLQYKSLDAAKKSDVFAAAAARATWIDHRRTYRLLLRNKGEVFWRSTIDSQHRSPRQLRSSIDILLGRGSVPSSESIRANDFNQFFYGKVAAVRLSTVDAPSPTFTETDFVFNKFQPIKVDEVITATHRLPDKLCFYDPIPTSLLKINAKKFTSLNIVLRTIKSYFKNCKYQFC
jgi:hypothetical protein